MGSVHWGVVALIFSMFSGNALAATITWSGSTSTTWDNLVGSNWVGGVVPASSTTTDTAYFGATVAVNQPRITTNRSITGLIFASTTGGWNISSSSTAHTLSIGSGMGIDDSTNVSGTTTISANASTSSATVFPVATNSHLVFTGRFTTSISTNRSTWINFSTGSNGLVTFSSTFALAEGSATANRQTRLSGTGNVLISGNIVNFVTSGSTGSLEVTNAGVITLAGTNTYTGTTGVLNGTLVFQRTAAKAPGTVTASSTATIGLGVGGTGFYSETDVDNLFDGTLTGFSLNGSTGVAIDTTAGNFTQSTSLTSARALTKLGPNTLTLSGSNTYSGQTRVRVGTLHIGAAGSINSTSSVTVNGSAAEFKYNSSTALSQPLTLTEGILSGTGAIGSAVSVGSNATLSPGNSPGTQPFSAGLTWLAGGTYDWEINNATGTKGADPGWDLIDVTGGTLNLASLTSSAKFNLDLITLNGLTSGSMANYTPGQPYTWQIVRTLADGVVTSSGAAAAGTDVTSLFNLVTTNWASGPVPSTVQVKVSADGAGLDLVVVPEPETLVLAGIGSLMAGWSFWKRRRIASICGPRA